MDPGQVIHDIQMWGGWSWSGWVAVGSIATFFALVVALALGLGAQRLIFKPRLKVSLEPGMPDFCPVETTEVVTNQVQTVDQSTGDVETKVFQSSRKASDQYYCRFKVSNDGGRIPANNVEVLLSELWDIGNAEKPTRVQPFLPVQLSWADMVTSPQLRPELEVTVPMIQPNVFRYCNLCFVDRGAANWLEFSAKPIPNQMQGKWPTKHRPGRYEVDVVLAAANFGREYITFLIDFKGGAWPNDDNFDGMFTAKFLRQDKAKPKHPIAPTGGPLHRALGWLGLPVWMLVLIASIWIVLAVLAFIPSNHSSLEWIAGYAVVLPLGALLAWASPRWAQVVLVAFLIAGFGAGLAAGGLPAALGYVAIFPFAWILPVFLLWLVRNAN